MADKLFASPTQKCCRYLAPFTSPHQSSIWVFWYSCKSSLLLIILPGHSLLQSLKLARFNTLLSHPLCWLDSCSAATLACWAIPYTEASGSISGPKKAGMNRHNPFSIHVTVDMFSMEHFLLFLKKKLFSELFLYFSFRPGWSCISCCKPSPQALCKSFAYVFTAWLFMSSYHSLNFKQKCF